MAGLKSIMVVLAIMMTASFQLQFTMAKTRHVVGETLGWTIPPGGEATYATWASNQKFVEGDTLIFNFPTGLHNVAEIPQTSYGQCNTTKTFSINPNGPATITLTRPGKHYYICTVFSHCQLGQKLTINVTPSKSRSPQYPPTSPSPFGSPISPISGATRPSLIMVVPVTFLAVALAFFY